MVLQVHRAQRADALADGLAGLLAEPLPDPFARELVIVPARGVERWLSQRLSHRLGPTPGDQDGVCAGVDFRSPASLVAELTGTADEDPWAPDALVWPLLTVVDAGIDEPWARVLAIHLGHGLEDEREATLRRGRRFAVARRLAGLFATYAVQRPQLLADWEAGSDTDGAGGPLADDLAWQPELWRRVTALVDAPTPCARHREVVAGLRGGTLDHELPDRISLFGHTTMSAGEAELLAALGARRDVHLWLPHPSAALWDSGEPTHPLLVTLARDLRELRQTLRAVGAEDRTPTAEPERPATLLGRVQADIAADRAPTPLPAGAADADTSVQVHACHGPSRQVEVLREVLLGLLADDPTLEPRDILVMCPDIEAYAPLVSASFGLGEAVAGGHPGQQLRVMLADRSPTQTNPLLGVLGKVLDLADGRVEASRVLDLLATDPVRRRFSLGDSDLETVTGWVGRAGVRWAYDAEHRAAYGLSAFPQNTWRFGLDRILAGVALSDDSDLWLGPTLPLDDVASTSIGLAGRLAEALDRLQALTDALHGEHPVQDWLDLLRDGIEQLTDVSRGEEWQIAQLHRELARIGDAALAAGGGVRLRLADVRALLHRQLAGRPSRASFRTGTLTVCTLTPMRSVPHRVVCLLGLDDEVFPRRGSVDGDDVLGRRQLPGERDPRSQDRQLFLDAVMSAGEHLVITYTGFHESTGHPRPPSVPLQELLDVLGSTAPRADGRDRVVRHRSQSFHRDYLAPDGLVARGGAPATFSFDPGAADAARAAARKSAAPARMVDLDLGPAPREDIDLADLVDTVVNPVRAFVRRRLGLDLPWEEDPVADTMPVALTGLDQWQVGDRVLQELLAGRTPEHALQAEWRRGTLPPGRYGWRIARQVCDAAAPLADLAEACRQGVPASTCDVDVDLGQGRRLVGTVPDVHGDRLVRVGFSRLGARQRLEAWVHLVALAAAGRRGQIAGTIGRAAEGDAPARGTYRSPEDPAAVLRDLVALHDAALTRPLPFAAETTRTWVRTRDSRRPEWQLRKDLEKAWRTESAKPEMRLVWDGRPRLDDLEADPGFDHWARAVWAPALASEAE